MVKFSQGDEDLETIIFSLNDILKERLGQPLLAPNDASQSQQTLLGANLDYQSTDEGVLTEDEKVLKDLGSFLLSIQGIHDELYSPELDSRINQIEDPSQNTFNWIFSLPLFSQWLRKKSGLFWISGKPGSGKSTLMKHVFQSQSTKDLSHKWETSSIDIKAGFFFHYRGTAIQKSLEGVLRSLIIHILKPHRIAFQKKYQGTWEIFQSFIQRYRTLEGQRASFEYELDAIVEEKVLMGSERDLKEKLQRAMNNSKSEANEQMVGDIKQQLSLLHRRMEEVSKRSLDFREREPELQQKLKQVRADIAAVSRSISSLAEKARPYQTQPETRFLRSLVNELQNDSNSQVDKLEQILRLLLDQDIMNINLVLFFDALDEFDGHIENISDFLTNLLERSTTSKTQIKVCFSSRPQESLNDHFTKYPGFRLQDYTTEDIEQYAKISLARSEIMNFSQREEFMKIIPSIIARANGVFLWVRLAMKELFDTAGGSPEAELFGRLKKKLQELPDDLLKFYKHIIERISGANRRYTFALLELLARHAGLSVSVTDIWGAVLTSGCTTFEESLEVLQKISGNTGQKIATDSDRDQRAISDISAWAGGTRRNKGAE
ncbi:uncharacterized protein TrAtP1_009250 [Trichoderma atroviride]|uniref:uncharacterized protein n=1 Tax=Hypocrea atroviridis TaxID=63577 RepID=UPI00331D3F59|nr:hypothetical protein TrAtP1_009250 [Trichoderma atroviride]